MIRRDSEFNPTKQETYSSYWCADYTTQANTFDDLTWAAILKSDWWKAVIYRFPGEEADGNHHCHKETDEQSMISACRYE